MMGKAISLENTAKFWGKLDIHLESARFLEEFLNIQNCMDSCEG